MKKLLLVAILSVALAAPASAANFTLSDADFTFTYTASPDEDQSIGAGGFTGTPVAGLVYINSATGLTYIYNGGAFAPVSAFSYLNSNPVPGQAWPDGQNSDPDNANVIPANADVIPVKLNITDVPEPISVAVLGAGLLGIGLARRRRGP